MEAVYPPESVVFSAISQCLHLITNQFSHHNRSPSSPRSSIRSHSLHTPDPSSRSKAGPGILVPCAKHATLSLSCSHAALLPWTPPSSSRRDDVNKEAVRVPITQVATLYSLANGSELRQRSCTSKLELLGWVVGSWVSWKHG